MTTREQERQDRRLLNVARALRESPAPEDFDMDFYRKFCGTPACALGHYAARRDLQSTFFFPENSRYIWKLVRPQFEIFYDSPCVQTHFGLDEDESPEIFGGNGCGNAKTAIQAAKYIEKFVKNRKAKRERANKQHTK